MPLADLASSPGLRVLFMGTPAIAVPTLVAVASEHEIVAVVTQPDRAAGRGRKLVASPVKVWAEEAKVPVLQPERVRDAAARTLLADTRPDVAVVVAFGQILPAEILAIPRLGCVNLHASLLPRFRGASPIQGAILAGDRTSGVTTMMMDEGLDTGPILEQRVVGIAGDDTAATLADKLGAAGAELMLGTLRLLAAGELQPRPQDADAATTTRRIVKADGRIVWRQKAAAIDRHVRAMQPWPVAYTLYAGERLKVWSVLPAADPESRGVVPGTVLESASRLVVACGEGEAVEVTELQRPGSRRMPAADLLRGCPIACGVVLGEADPVSDS
jgi:methionyl-tRNA formyltransferase